MRVLACVVLVGLVQLGALGGAEAGKHESSGSSESTEVCEAPRRWPNLCPPVSDCECNSFCLDDLLCTSTPWGFWPCDWVCKLVHGTNGFCKPCECHKKSHGDCDCDCCRRQSKRCICECPRPRSPPVPIIVSKEEI